MNPRRKRVADQTRLLGLVASEPDDDRDPDEDDEEDDCFFDDDEPYFDDEEEDDWQLRPHWLHPDCVNACTALELGACCKYPDNPLVRVAVELADSVDAALGRFGHGDCAGMAADLARLLRSVPGLLAQVHAILPRLNATATAQLLCPVGRLASALDQACGDGCPWACHDPAVPGRRGELEPLRPLLAECSNAIRAALGWPSRS